MREPSRPTHRTPHTSSNLMTIPDLSANADIVVIGFGGTTPVKVRLKLPPAVFSSAFTILGVLLPRWICRACAFGACGVIVKSCTCHISSRAVMLCWRRCGLYSYVIFNPRGVTHAVFFFCYDCNDICSSLAFYANVIIIHYV